MSARKVIHDSFTIERVFDAAPQRLYDAFATLEGKARWFVGPPGWTLLERQFDFRVGGGERVAGRFADGTVSLFDAVYHDIVPAQRIVYSYRMAMGDTPISVSLASLEITADGAKAHLKMTEQGAFLDDFVDGGGREHGSKFLLEQLAATLD